MPITTELEVSIRPEQLAPEQWVEAFKFFDADHEFDAKEIVAAITFKIEGSPDDYDISSMKWLDCYPVPASLAPDIERLIRDQHGECLETYIADRCGYVWTGDRFHDGEWRAER